MKKIIALLLVVLTVFTLSGCNGYYTGHFYEAHCNSEELNVTRITVRLHNKEDVCCITYIDYELEYFDGDEVNIYIPQEVIVTESGKAYTVRSLGGQGMFRHSIYIFIKDREFTDEECQALKVNIHLGDVELDENQTFQITINQNFHRNYDNQHFVK